MCFEEMSPPSSYFFFLRMRAYHHGPRHPLRVRVHYSTEFSLHFSVFGSCHRFGDAEEDEDCEGTNLPGNSFVALFLGLKNLCIVPANAPDPRKYRINQNERTMGVAATAVIRHSFVLFVLLLRF
jgi:hypothetical protein